MQKKYLSLMPKSLRGGTNELVWSKASGSYVYDHQGRRYIDLTSGFGVSLIGHSHPKVAQAVASQAGNMIHAMPSIFPHDLEAAICESISERSPILNPEVIITNSGSEAVEVALKVAYRRSNGGGVAFLDGAYHGQSLGVIAINGIDGLRTPFQGVWGYHCEKVPFPKGDGADSLASLEAKFSDGVVSTVIVEPMQNPAGYRLLSNAFCDDLSRLCRKWDVLLIIDEIFTGFGRCGEWSLGVKLGLKGDIYCFGKSLTGGIPGGVCVMEAGLSDNLSGNGGIPLHSSTFMYNPVVCAAMLESIQVIADEGVLEKTRWLEAFFTDGLNGLSCGVDWNVSVRAVGAAIAIQVDGLGEKILGADVVNWCVRELRDQGVLVLNSGFPAGNVIAIAPTVALSKVEADKVCEKIISVMVRYPGGFDE